MRERASQYEKAFRYRDGHRDLAAANLAFVSSDSKAASKRTYRIGQPHPFIADTITRADVSGFAFILDRSKFELTLRHALVKNHANINSFLCLSSY